MCRHAVKKVTYLLRYIPQQYEIHQMHDKAILENKICSWLQQKTRNV